ncbi:LacI family DNA-binding transcriptional regulator [Priestia megaterium]|uniref:LacI family DNA-binding transcriptional regulator n=1 Tax=Priestia megaterium TaxID=1404 RepID=UPI002E24D9F7|nr:LacI family DNA-binding transcriptional regulator [Priestia megaterium]
MKKKVTIRDVAKYAGVSRTTVSYVVNGVNKISEETREKVFQAIKDLQYQPDFTAISLTKKKSNIIGVVLPASNDSLAPIFKQNHYYNEILAGLEYVFRKQNYDLLFSALREPEDCKNWVIKRNLDGLIFLNQFPESLYLEMKNLDIPIVLADCYEKHANQYHNIKIDDELGGYLATKHLIDRGHTHISFVGHDLTNISIDMKRFYGYKKALEEAGLTVDENLLFDGRGSYFDIGYEMGLKLLGIEKKTTAIFACSDILAVGIIKALSEQGKEIPKDYSIVGYDDIVLSNYSLPSLTTIRQDVFNKGVICAETLINTIETKTLELKNITLPIELVVRSSTKDL